MLDRRHKSFVGMELLVPPSIGRRKCRADKHLIDRREQLHPGKTLSKRRSIAREEFGKVRVLEIPDPVGDAEMA
jgi:hypothetical protein